MLKQIQDKIETLDDLSFIERIQTLEKLKWDHGQDFIDLLRAHVKRKTIEEWHRIAAIHPRHTLEEFMLIEWEHISRSAGMEYSVNVEDHAQHVTCFKCPLADMAQAIDAMEWGYIYYCERSLYASKTFNPDIAFERTHTLMQGDAVCDHCYKIKP